MSVESHITSNTFLLFQDEILHKKACQAVEQFLEECDPVDNVQLHSIPVVIQAGGLSGLRDLIENQKEKNTKEKNRKFWEFIYDLVLSVPGPAHSFRSCIEEELSSLDLLQDETQFAEKIQKKRVRKANRVQVEKVINHTLPIYFEHFNCHYFYKTRRGEV